MDDDTLTICGVEYSLCGTIGEGGAASVYLARSKGIYFAIKQVRNYNNPIIKESVNTEIDIQKKFAGDPHIIQYIDVEFTRKIAYIVLEIGTCSLRNVIDHKQIRQKEFLNIVCDLCQGLQSVHHQQIIHRDIKPQNVILKNGVYKITDFGISCEKEEDNIMVGTIGYEAPQILFKDKETYTNKIDIWSMGVTVFEVLFKINPFCLIKSENPKQIKQEMKNNINILTKEQFTMHKFLDLLKTRGLKDKIKYVEKKMSIINKEILSNICLFFERDPAKREDIQYIRMLFESLKSSLPAPFYKKVKINVIHQEKDMPSEIRMMMNTLNLLYELETEAKYQDINSTVFSIELAMWYLTGTIYGNVHLTIPENLKVLKKHLKTRKEVWEEIRSGILPYFIWLNDPSSDLQFFQKKNQLKLGLLMCSNWNILMQQFDKFCNCIREITKFQICHPIQIFQFLQMYSDKNIREILQLILNEFY